MDEESKELYDDDEITEAIKRFKSMIKKNIIAYFDVYEIEGIVDYFMDEGHIKMAKKAVRTGLKMHPSTPSLLLKKAQILAFEGKPEKCLQLLSVLEKIETTNADLYLVKGSALNMIGDVEKAIEAYEKAVAYDTEDPDEILYSIGITFGQTGEINMATHYLERAYKANPRNEMILYELGYFYEHNDQIEKSIEYYNKYLDIDPFNSSVWYNLGIAYNQCKHYDEAINAYDFAIALNDKFAQAYFNKANTYSNKEDYDQAISCYKEYLKMEPESDDAYTYLGDCYSNTGEYKLALKYYKKATKINDTNPDAFNGAGVVLWKENKPKESYFFLKNAALLAPSNSDFWTAYANICKILKNNEEAVVAYRQLTRISPENTEYLLDYSDILHETGEMTQAINVLKKAEKQNLSEAIINCRLTAYLLENKNDTEAAIRFEKALKSDSNSYYSLFEYYPEAQKMEMIKSLISKYTKENQ